MDHNVGLFQSLAADDSDRRVAHRKSLAVANKRVSDRFGAFLAAAKTREEYSARLDLIRADVQEAVASVCSEHGGDPDRIERSILSHMAGASRVADIGRDERREIGDNSPIHSMPGTFPAAYDSGEQHGPDHLDQEADELFQEGHDLDGVIHELTLRGVDPTQAAQVAQDALPVNAYPPNPEQQEWLADQGTVQDDYNSESRHFNASVREARRPKMCPYHKEVTDISLASGDPTAGFNAMSQHAWGAQHCQGEFEGGCNFKPAMVTQKFWDDKAEQASERRERREQERAEQIQQEQTITEVPDSPEGLEDTPAPVEEGSLDADLAEAPSAVGEGYDAPEPVSDLGSLEPMAASHKTADIEALRLAIHNFQGELQDAESNGEVSFDAISRAEEAINLLSQEVEQLTGDVQRHFNAAYNKEGEALKTIDVEQSEGPSPEINKSKIPADGQKLEDVEMDGSPHPTKTVDPLEPIIPDNESDFLEGTKAVSEKQDVEQASSFNGDKAESGSWKGNNGASPVTSSNENLTSAVDPDKNPIIESLKSSFAPQVQVDQAIDEWNQNQ